MISTSAHRSTCCSISWTTRRRWWPSPATDDTAMPARCQRSWWSTSATDTLNLCRSDAVRVLTTWRFSLRERTPGMRRSKVHRTASVDPTASSCDRTLPERAGDLTDLVGLDHVALVHVLVALEGDAALEAL